MLIHIIQKKASKLNVNDIKSSENTKVNLMATLKDSSNKDIANKKIQFIINEKIYVGTTDNGGIAKISFKDIKGSYSINAKFLGDNPYSSSSGTGKLTITKNGYNLKVNSISADKNKKTQLKAVLTHNNKKQLIRRLSFMLIISQLDQVKLIKMVLLY